MISTGQILAAGVVTGVAVAVTAKWVRWPVPRLLVASIGSLVLIIVWRGVSNALQLNGDFVPAVSVGDVGCLLFGAVAPAAVASMTGTPSRLRWLPAVVGGVVGFVVNVAIL